MGDDVRLLKCYPGDWQVRNSMQRFTALLQEYTDYRCCPLIMHNKAPSGSLCPC